MRSNLSCFSYMFQISMPGMMDTVLNLGLNDEVVVGLASKNGERFAYDSYRRFLDMFGDVVSTSFISYAPNGILSMKIVIDTPP